MKETYKAINESEISILAEADLSMYESLDTLTESQLQLTGFTPDKVIVLLDEATNTYLIEFDDNIERLMDDSKSSFAEALTMVCAENAIRESETKVIVTDKSLDKFNISEFSNEEYGFVKK